MITGYDSYEMTFTVECESCSQVTSYRFDDAVAIGPIKNNKLSIRIPKCSCGYQELLDVGKGVGTNEGHIMNMLAKELILKCRFEANEDPFDPEATPASKFINFIGRLRDQYPKNDSRRSSFGGKIVTIWERGQSAR